MDVGAYVSFGWNTFKANPAPYIITTVVVMIANVALGVAGSFLSLSLGFVVGLAGFGFALGAVMQMGLKGARGQNVDPADVAVMLQRPVDFIVVGLVIGAGGLLGGIGVLVTATLFAFAMFLVLQGAGYQQALSLSLNAVKARFVEVLLVMVVVFALNMAGFVMCGIGLLVSVPVGAIVMAKAFDDFGFGSNPLGGTGGVVTPPPYQGHLP